MISSELSGVVVAVVGGDLRMLEHMRQAREAGATVQHYGGIPGATEAAGVPEASSLAEAIKNATIISCPIPGVNADGSLFAKYTDEPLRLTSEILNNAAPGAVVFTYKETPQLIDWAKGTRARILGYGEDDELCILHAIPTAEGAIKVAVENTQDTLLGMKVLCFGLGRVGVSVAQAFDAMKAHVTVTARNPAQLARALSMGYNIIPLKDVLEHVDQFSLIVSSVTGKVITSELIAKTCPEVLIIDLCSPPGSVDRDAAEQMKRRFVWARAQAGTAPRSAGRHEWKVLMRIARETIPQLRT